MSGSVWAPILTFLGVVVSAAIGWWGSRLGANASRDTSEIANRGEEWDRLFDRFQAVSDKEFALRDREMASLRDRMDSQEAEIRELKRKYSTLREEHSQLWELFTTAMETLQRWILWSDSGGRGSPPLLPEILREHLPRD